MVRVRGDDRVIEVEHERAVRIDEFRQSALRRAVALERAVAVEMVGGDVRVHGNRRAARQRRQLELRQLDHDSVPRRELRQPLDERDPDVAAQDDRVIGIRGEDRGDERRRRGLALGPGDPDRRRRAQSEEQVGFRNERRHRLVPAGSSRDELAKRLAQPRLGRREVGIDRRRGRYERRAGPRR
jgi:hypothetical protein